MVALENNKKKDQSNDSLRLQEVLIGLDLTEMDDKILNYLSNLSQFLPF